MLQPLYTEEAGIAASNSRGKDEAGSAASKSNNCHRSEVRIAPDMLQPLHTEEAGIAASNSRGKSQGETSMEAGAKGSAKANFNNSKVVSRRRESSYDSYASSDRESTSSRRAKIKFPRKQGTGSSDEEAPYTRFAPSRSQNVNTWERDSDSDALLEFPHTEVRSPPRKRRRDRRDPRYRSSSEPEGSQDGDGYKRFQAGQHNQGTWRLTKDAKKYASKAFRSYIPERDIQEITLRHPKPDHGFLEPQTVDDNIQDGLQSAIGQYHARAVLHRDQTLANSQEKVMRIMGPLGKIWATLDKARKSKSERMIRIQDLLNLTEQAVVLTGQASVAAQYARRREILSGLTSAKDAKLLMKKYDYLCDNRGDLFGEQFQKKMHDYSKERAGKSEGILSLKKKEYKSYSRKKPFHEAPPKEQPQGNFGGRPSHGRGYSHKGGQDSRGRGRGFGRGRATNRYVHPTLKNTKGSKSGEGPYTNDQYILLLPGSQSASGTHCLKPSTELRTSKGTRGHASKVHKELAQINRQPTHTPNDQRVADPVFKNP